MPSPAFLIFEVSVYLLGLLCLRHAWQRGLRFVSELMAGMAYGGNAEIRVILGMSEPLIEHVSKKA